MNRWSPRHAVLLLRYCLLVAGTQSAILGGNLADANSAQSLEILNSGFEQWEADKAANWIGEGSTTSRAAAVDVAEGRHACRAVFVRL